MLSVLMELSRGGRTENEVNQESAQLRSTLKNLAPTHGHCMSFKRCRQVSRRFIKTYRRQRTDFLDWYPEMPAEAFSLPNQLCLRVNPTHVLQVQPSNCFDPGGVEVQREIRWVSQSCCAPEGQLVGQGLSDHFFL